MGRLEVKLLALLVLLTGLPVGIAAWQAGKLFEQSLSSGVNPVISTALEDAVEVFGDYLRAEKGRQRANAARLAESRGLATATAQGVSAVQAWADTVLAADESITGVTLTPASGVPITAMRPLEQPDRWLLRELSIPVEGVPGWSTLTYSFRHERAIIDRFRRMETEVIQPFAALKADRSDIADVFAWSFVAYLGVALGLAALIAVFVGRRLTGRLKRLREGMVAVAKGDLGTFVEPAGRDEVAELTTGFNDMTKQLRESQERVQYLTQVSAWQGIARRLAHEIKNPLTPIQLAVQQMQQSYKGDDARYQKTIDTAREIVEEEVHTLKRLVENFSRFARLPTASLERADLSALAEDLVIAHPEIEDLAAETDGPIEANIDRGLIRQALTNLLKNGDEAARDAGHSARIRMRVSREGAWCIIAVEDNGPGVPEEDRERVFEPYITGKSDGTGLGLAIVKKIIVEHEGTIAVESTSEGGARFVIRLPAVG